METVVIARVRQRIVTDISVERQALQPSGWILVCDDRASVLRRHSSNVASLFPGAGDCLGSELRELFGADSVHGLRNALSRFPAPGRAILLPGCILDAAKGLFDLSALVAGEETLIEIEPASGNDALMALDHARAMIDRLQNPPNLERLAQVAARLTFSLLQYDAAAIVRFADDGSPLILAEHKRGDLTACSPEAVRALARDLRPGRVRMIGDARAEELSLVSSAGAGACDLQACLMRAATPAEKAVLLDAGFVASLALGLFVDGGLWGMILCRNGAPRRLNMCERAAVELFGEFLALQAQVLRLKEDVTPPRRNIS